MVACTATGTGGADEVMGTGGTLDHTSDDTARNFGRDRTVPSPVPDNLDRTGRAFVREVPSARSIASARDALGDPVRALAPGGRAEPGAGVVVAAVPARHGPPGSEPMVGEVIGFVLSGAGLPAVCISGGNAAPEHVAGVAQAYRPVEVAVLFAGAACPPAHR